jgi:hypothetical protein
MMPDIMLDIILTIVGVASASVSIYALRANKQLVREAQQAKNAAHLSATAALSHWETSLTCAQAAGNHAADAKQMKDAAERAVQDAITHSNAALAHANLAENQAKLSENHARVGLEFLMSAASRFASSLFKPTPTAAPAEISTPPPPASDERLMKRKKVSEETLRVARQILQTPNVNW